MQQTLLVLITIMHILFILFVVITPFTNNNYLLLLHAVVIPFVLFHWILNDDTCVLTMIERFLKKSIYKDNYSEESCFTCRLIEPVYNFVDDNKKFSKIIYITIIILWFISSGKLLYKYHTNQITNWKDLFII